MLLASLGQTDVSLYIIALLLSALSILIRSYKWQLLLRIQGAEVSLNAAHALSYMALFFNNFFLGSIGGDAFKVYRTQGYSATKSGAIAAVLVERFSSTLILFLVVSLSYVLYLFSDAKVLANGVPYPFLAASFLFVIASGIATSRFLQISYVRQCMPFLKKFSDLLLYHIALHKAHVPLLSLCMFLSLAFYIISVLSMYLFVLSAHAYVSIAELFFIVPLSMLIILLPISINGIGIQEGAFVFYFERLGIEPTLALTIALLPRIGMFLFSVVGGIIYLIDCFRNK